MVGIARGVVVRHSRSSRALMVVASMVASVPEIDVPREVYGR